MYLGFARNTELLFQYTVNVAEETKEWMSVLQQGGFDSRRCLDESTRVSTVGSNGHGSEWGSGAASLNGGCCGSEMEG